MDEKSTIFWKYWKVVQQLFVMVTPQKRKSQKNTYLKEGCGRQLRFWAGRRYLWQIQLLRWQSTLRNEQYTCQRYLEQIYFCQYLCQYLPPTYPQQLPELACMRWQHRAPERFTRRPVQKIVLNSLQAIILQSLNIILFKTNALWWAKKLGLGQEFLFKWLI